MRFDSEQSTFEVGVVRSLRCFRQESVACTVKKELEIFHIEAITVQGNKDTLMHRKNATVLDKKDKIYGAKMYFGNNAP